MNIIAWIFVGLVAGLLARWIVRDDRSGCVYTVAVGVLGALIGGALMHASGHEGINEFSLRSLGRRRARGDLVAVGAAGDQRRPPRHRATPLASRSAAGAPDPSVCR